MKFVYKHHIHVGSLHANSTHNPQEKLQPIFPCSYREKPRKWKACNKQTQPTYSVQLGIEPRPLRKTTNARFFVGTITAKKNDLVPARRVPERITPVPHEWQRSRNLYASTVKKEVMQCSQ